MLEALLQEVNEDRLGAAPIRPGDTVIIKIRFPFLRKETKLGGTTI